MFLPCRPIFCSRTPLPHPIKATSMTKVIIWKRRLWPCISAHSWCRLKRPAVPITPRVIRTMWWRMIPGLLRIQSDFESAWSLTSIKPAAWGPWRSRLPGVPSSKNSGRHDALAGWPILHFSLAAGLPCRPTFCSRHSPTPTFLGHALASFSPLADRTAQRSRETLKKRT